MCYQITTDNYEQNESPLAPENLIRVSILQLYICILIKLIVIFKISDLSLFVSDNYVTTQLITAPPVPN